MRGQRIVLGVLLLISLVTGLWALLAPRSFYDSFPGGSGMHWVSADGPYNQHLVRDFGSLNLALAVVAMVALWRPTRELLIAVGLANLAYGIPHLVYHLRHLDVYDTSDKIANIAALSSVLVLPLLLLWVAFFGGSWQTGRLREREDPLEAPL